MLVQKIFCPIVILTWTHTFDQNFKNDLRRQLNSVYSSLNNTYGLDSTFNLKNYGMIENVLKRPKLWVRIWFAVFAWFLTFLLMVSRPTRYDCGLSNAKSPTKGPLILKCTFGVFNFLQKLMNTNQPEVS